MLEILQIILWIILLLEGVVLYKKSLSTIRKLNNLYKRTKRYKLLAESVSRARIYAECGDIKSCVREIDRAHYILFKESEYAMKQTCVEDKP